MKLVLIYNPHSGSALSAKELRAKCRDHNIEITALIPIDDGFEAKVKRRATKNQIIAAIGGDGTLSSVAGILVDTEAVFAPLSGGTLNHFTKDLGISQDLDEALAHLKKSKVKRIDVAEVNSKVFINNSSIGLYPSSLQEREHFEDHLGKWPAAVIGSIRTLWQYRSYDVTIKGHSIKTPFIFVGNNDYRLDKLAEGGRKSLEKGVLSVYTINAASRLQLFGALGKALIGTVAATPDIKAWTTKEVAIKLKSKKIKVSRDGELEKLKAPLEYKIRAASLKVLGA